MHNNFFKEIFLKNDLTYLCLSLPFIITFLPSKMISYFIVGAAVFLLAYSWRMTFKKRYILNSMMKFMIVGAILIASLNLLTINPPYFSFIKSTIGVVFVSIYLSYVMTSAYCLYSNAEEYYESEYHPEYEDSYRYESYLRSIYTVLRWNNTIEYRYDKHIDAYLYYDTLYENIIHEKLYCGVANSGIGRIAAIRDYITYLHEHGLSSKSMNTDELAVFKMYSI